MSAVTIEINTIIVVVTLKNLAKCWKLWVHI